MTKRFLKRLNMSADEALAYKIDLRNRYNLAGREEKGAILDQICTTFGLNRKYAIRMLNSEELNASAGRRLKYAGDEIQTALRAIREASGGLCSKRLEAAIPHWITGYEQSKGTLSAEDRSKLLSISSSSIDRLFRRDSNLNEVSEISLPKLTSSLVGNRVWDVKDPGTIEISLRKVEAINSEARILIALDLCTGWVAMRLVMIPGLEQIKAALSAVVDELPFEIVAVHLDVGTKFQLKVVKDFLSQRLPQAGQSIHIDTARAFDLGPIVANLDPRIADQQVSLVGLLYNHFIPQLNRGGKAELPYDRVRTSQFLTVEQKEGLETLHRILDPFQIVSEMRGKMNSLSQAV